MKNYKFKIKVLNINRMLNKKFFNKLQKEHTAAMVERREIIGQSNDILHDSKRAIFAMHRGDFVAAGDSLKKIEKLMSGLQKKFGVSRVEKEGAYGAGVEEYVEAKLLYLVLTDEKIDEIKGLDLSFSSYLGGLSDLTGELVRYAVNQAAQRNFKEVEKAKNIITDIMAQLVEFDLTSYLRTKYDQAKQNLRKIEQINYEVAMKSTHNT